MEKKNIVIIALTVLVIYLYYCQTLYQKEEEKGELVKAQQQKINSLETSLLNLAKQKIKNQKEALKLVEKLEAE